MAVQVPFTELLRRIRETGTITSPPIGVIGPPPTTAPNVTIPPRPALGPAPVQAPQPAPPAPAPTQTSAPIQAPQPTQRPIPGPAPVQPVSGPTGAPVGAPPPTTTGGPISAPQPAPRPIPGPAPVQTTAPPPPPAPTGPLHIISPEVMQVLSQNPRAAAEALRELPSSAQGPDVDRLRALVASFAGPLQFTAGAQGRTTASDILGQLQAGTLTPEEAQRILGVIAGLPPGGVAPQPPPPPPQQQGPSNTVNPFPDRGSPGLPERAGAPGQLDIGNLIRMLMNLTPRQYFGLLPSQKQILASIFSGLGLPPEDAFASIERQFPPGANPNRVSFGANF